MRSKQKGGLATVTSATPAPAPKSTAPAIGVATSASSAPSPSSVISSGLPTSLTPAAPPTISSYPDGFYNIGEANIDKDLDLHLTTFTVQNNWSLGKTFTNKKSYPIYLNKSGTNLTYGVLNNNNQFCPIMYYDKQGTTSNVVYNVFDNMGVVQGIVGLHSGKFHPTSIAEITNDYLLTNLPSLLSTPSILSITIYRGPNQLIGPPPEPLTLARASKGGKRRKSRKNNSRKNKSKKSRK